MEDNSGVDIRWVVGMLPVSANAYTANKIKCPMSLSHWYC